MITLSDYLDYLNGQFVAARKQADEAAVELARAYAEDEYLQHFKVPRFTMPTIKLKVPIKIDTVNQETKYDFDLKEKDFIGALNKRFKELSKKYDVRLKFFSKEEFNNRSFQRYLRELEERDQGFIRDVEHALPREEVDALYETIFPPNSPNNNPMHSKMLALAMRDVWYDGFKAQFRPLITNINNLAVTPQASGLNADDSDKLLIQLDLEMVEEAIQIRKIKDADGNIIEELVVD